MALILNIQQVIATLSARVQALEDQLAKHSGNSSKPPSSDGLKKKPTSLRAKGQHPMGDQAGHKGKTLKFSLNPDQIEVHEARWNGRRRERPRSDRPIFAAREGLLRLRSAPG